MLAGGPISEDASTGAHAGADNAAGDDLGPATEALPIPAAVPAPPQPGQPGWLLGGRYQVIDRIGAGGMAEVFRAHDQLLARDVAVKVFRTHTDPDEVTGGVQRQELELQTLARLSHPNLITLFDGSIGSDGEPAFLVMELIDGPSLAAQIAQAPLTEPETREIAIQIAGALAYVHAQHMVHRDIKPANILLGADGAIGDNVRARLSDFGIVRLLGSEHLTSADFLIGTASYLAPEQARGAEVGPAADVYALALVLIEALTGRRSFEGPALEAVLARLERSPEIPAGLPEPWPELLQAMTATDPELRPGAAEVARTLRDGVAMATPMLAVPVPGSEPLAGEAVLAGGAPLAAASGLAGTAALADGAGFTDGTGPTQGAAFTDGAGFTQGAAFTDGTGFTQGAGFTDGAGFTAAAGISQVPLADPAADPELPTAFISTGLAPMPPPVDDEPAEPHEPDRRSAVRAGRGPLVGAAVAAALLLTAATAGGLLLVRDPSAKDPSLLPGQSVSSSTRPQSGAKPSSTPTSLAPIGSVPSAGTGVTTGRTSSGATSSAPSSSSAAPTSSSARPTSSAPRTSSAPPSSSSAAPTSSAPPSSSGSSTPSNSVSPSGSATGTGTTSAAPAGVSSPAIGTGTKPQ